MIEKKKIKVIKKDQAAAISKSKPTKSKRVAARQIVANVGEWVAELQARKKQETKQALEHFLASSPAPSEL